MQYRVFGAHRETGDEQQITVEADSEQQAIGQAADQNLLVARVEPIEPPKVPPATTIPEADQLHATSHWVWIVRGVIAAVLLAALITILIFYGKMIWTVLTLIFASIAFGFIAGSIVYGVLLHNQLMFLRGKYFFLVASTGLFMFVMVIIGKFGVDEHRQLGGWTIPVMLLDLLFAAVVAIKTFLDSRKIRDAEYAAWFHSLSPRRQQEVRDHNNRMFASFMYYTYGPGKDDPDTRPHGVPRPPGED